MVSQCSYFFFFAHMGEAAKSALEYRQGEVHKLCTFFMCAQFNDYSILPL